MKQPISRSQKVLNIWAIILIIWAIYRAYFRTQLPIWFDEFVAKPTVFLLPVFYYITYVEKVQFFKGIDLKFKNASKDIMWGLGVGVIFLIIGGLGSYFKHGSLQLSTNISDLLFLVIISLATAITEETLSRGFVLKRLYEESKNALSSSFLASILFFFLHIPILFTNDKIIGFLLIQVMVTDLILSLAVSFIFLERRNLLVPILIHAFYAISLYMFI